MKRFLMFIFILLSLFSLSSCSDLENFDFDNLDQWLEDFMNNNGMNDETHNNFEKGDYTINFDLNGLGSMEEYSIPNIKKVPDILPEPTPIKGYQFEGWYKDRYHTQAVVPGEVLERDITLYAEFSLIEYTVKYVYNEEVLAEYQILHGQTISHKPTITVDEGYVLKGWGIDGVVFTGRVESDLVLEPVIAYVDIITIEEFKQKADTNAYYFIKGVVTAANYDRDTPIKTVGSYILSDETGHLFVYSKAQVYLGDEVLLSALYKEYYSVPEVVTHDYIEILSINNQYMSYCKEYVEYEVSDMEKDQTEKLDRYQLVDKYYNQYLKINGLLVKQGSSFYLTESVNGTYKIKLFGDYRKMEFLVDKVVSVYGFMREARDDHSIYVQVETIVENSDTKENIKEYCELIREEVKIDKFIYDQSVILKTTTAYLEDAYLEYSIVGESITSSLEGNVLTVQNKLLDESEEVTIEIKIHYKDEVYIEYFTYVVEPITYTSVADFLATRDTVNFYLIKGIVINTQGNQGHMLADDTGVLFAYVNMEVNVGDEVVIYSKFQNYYGAAEIGVGSKYLETLSTGNDIEKYIPEVIERNIDDWRDEITKDDFDQDAFGEEIYGKLIHFKGYYMSSNRIACSDKSFLVIRLYSTEKLDVQIGQLVEVYGYFRAAKKGMYVSIQVHSLKVVESDAIQMELEQFYNIPDEYLGKKVVFEGIIIEKVEDGLFIASQIKNKKEYRIYVEGDFNIGDKYCFIGHIELFGENKNNYIFTRKKLHLDPFTADVLRKISESEYIILDSSIEYEPHYGGVLFKDGMVTSCTYENNVLSFYVSTQPHNDSTATFVFVVSVELEVENIDTQFFIGKKVSGKLYKETLESINTHFVLDLSLIIFS